MAGFWHGRPRRFISGHNSKGMRRGEGRYVNAHGYVLLRLPSHPRAASMGGYVMEHRYLMEQHLGRYLELNEHVHHINHDRSDNRLENLMLIDPVEHAKYHTSQSRRPQSEEHRRKTSEAMKRVWAERRRQG
ncbi:MAG: HNH endonuclease [Chloroflexi bacterium]|nr:HNH endonuclease [Chloroflexota bacterium]